MQQRDAHNKPSVQWSVASSIRMNVESPARTHVNQFNEHFIGRVPPGAQEDPLGTVAFEVIHLDDERSLLAIAKALSDFFGEALCIKPGQREWRLVVRDEPANSLLGSKWPS